MSDDLVPFAPIGTHVDARKIAQRRSSPKTSVPTYKGLSAFDEKLINGAARGMSPNELSRHIGGTLSAAECAVRVREMLADKNFWTDPERKQLLLHKVNQVVDDLFTLASSSQDNQDYSALIRALDLSRKTMAEMEGATEAEMAAMVRMQATQMMDYMDALMRRAREILAEENPDFDPNLIEEAIELAREDVRTADV
jgi:hypothetical protein